MPRFKPKRPKQRAIAEAVAAHAERPLYAGKIQRIFTSHYGERRSVSLPRVQWLEKAR
jgi:hypothetical protein